MITATVLVRPMAPEDAVAVADLAGQLGYPTDAGEVTERIARVGADEKAALLVAEEEGRVVGWAHVAVQPSLLEVPSAQLRALVVDEGHRSRGVGATLVGAAERWASARDITRMIVATRVTRERAHRFYEREGYALAKTSHLFEKHLT